MAGGRRFRRPVYLRWTVLAPAAAVFLVLVALANFPDRGGDRALRVTGDAGPLYLVPTGVEPRFHLDGVSDTATSPLAPWTFRAFGRRAPDGVTLSSSVVITMPSDRAVIGATPEPVPLQVLDREVAMAGNPFGQRILSWMQDDGRTVGVMTFGLSQAELVAVAESLLPADAATAVPALPAGFTAISSEVEAGVPMTFQSWGAEDGDRFSVFVVQGSAATVGDLGWWAPGSRARKVRGTTGVFVAPDKAYLVWIEQPGTVVTLQASRMSEQELVAIAEGLRPIDNAAWRELTSRVPPSSETVSGPDIGPPPGGASILDIGYFLIVPVRGTSAPPCAASSPGGPLAERTAAGQDATCYHVGRPSVYASDVDTAVSRNDGLTGRWVVEYTLTPRGTVRMEALAKELGAGGQFAIVVDGRIVSAPRVDRSTSGMGVVTDLDEQTARSLADRLGR